MISCGVSPKTRKVDQAGKPVVDEDGQPVIDPRYISVKEIV